MYWFLPTIESLLDQLPVRTFHRIALRPENYKEQANEALLELKEQKIEMFCEVSGLGLPGNDYYGM